MPSSKKTIATASPSKRYDLVDRNTLKSLLPILPGLTIEQARKWEHVGLFPRATKLVSQKKPRWFVVALIEWAEREYAPQYPAETAAFIAAIRAHQIAPLKCLP